ncbi:hypothetical protein RSOCI_03860 [Rhabdochlamydiaceae symbiont of Dictyostelium giganteum]
MEISTKILTTAGFIKFCKLSSSSQELKMRLYLLIDQSPQGIREAWLALEQELSKGRHYQGNINAFHQEIYVKPYLLKKGNHLKLISKEFFHILKKQASHSILIDQDESQKIETNSRDDSIKILMRCKNSITKIEKRYSCKVSRPLLSWISVLGQEPISEKLLQEGFRYIFPNRNILDFTYALKNLIQYSLLKECPSSDSKFYQIDSLLQEALYRELCFQVKIHLCMIASDLVFSEVRKPKQDQSLSKQELHCYLEHAHALLSREPMELTLDDMTENELHLELGLHFYEEKNYEKAFIQLSKTRESQLTATKNYSPHTSKVLNCLGNCYELLKNYEKAIEYHEKDLSRALELNEHKGQATAYTNLGNVYRSLGDYPRGKFYHEKSFRVTQNIKNSFPRNQDYCNLGASNFSSGNFSEALENYRHGLRIAQEHQDREGEGFAYSGLGNVYISIQDYEKAEIYHQKHLEIAEELNNEEWKGLAYGHLGCVYLSTGKIDLALKYHTKCLHIARLLKNSEMESKAYGNLGQTYRFLEMYTEAENCLYRSIEIASIFQQKIKEIQWQITIFEESSKAYLWLERVLTSQINPLKALGISDARRARVLGSLIFKRLLPLKEKKASFPVALSFQQMKLLAKKLHTTFIIYSLAPLQEEQKYIQAWLISSKEELSTQNRLAFSGEEFELPDKIFENFPYKMEIKRPTKNQKQSGMLFEEKLMSWYDILIKPLQPYLPLPDCGETLTFIPDGFLAHLPFGAFYHRERDQYLIEKYPISIAPSIQVLSLLDQLPKAFSNQALLIGNPTTPHEKENQLKYSEPEIREVIAPLMPVSNYNAFTQKEATIENIFKHAPQARYIHFACHGIAGEKPLDDPYSIFEGLFKLAPDAKHPSGYLHAKEVNSLELSSDLVFISACHLGRGNLQKEGSIGPIWSFLGAGARSTIASYWPLPEGDMTVKMVDTFYRHYLGIETPKLGKAKALQQAVLMAMKTERNKPRQWGAFFLSGLAE